ncbi:MAG: hypothetical protein ACLQT7_03765 [Candidatus Dormibacteria bacterium]
MTPIRPGSSPAAAVLALAAGLVLGSGIGLPTAHWVAGFLTPSLPVTATPSGSTAGPSPSASQPSSAPTTATPTSPAPSSAATPSPPGCSPLVSGQQPLVPLRSPPSGYKADPALDWIGCGPGTVPAADSLILTGSWLVAVAYTCPGGTAAGGSGSTLTVSEAGAAGSGSEVIIESRADSAVVTGGDLGGSPLTPGAYRLSVSVARVCLWHLAVYRG